MPSKKKSKRAPAKKAPVKTAQKKAATRSMGLRVTPYVLCVLALLLGVCFILVSFGGSTGELGEYIQAFFFALFGPVAFALPLLLGYIGVRWCIYNVKWTPEYLSSDHAEHNNYKKAKGRIVVQLIMAALVFLMICTLAGIFADQASFDLESFWSDGADSVGGGIFGGMLACLLLLLGPVLAIIIAALLTVLFAILAIGLTPDYILTKIHNKHQENAEIKTQQKQQRKDKNLAAAAAAATATQAGSTNERTTKSPAADEVVISSSKPEIPIIPSKDTAADKASAHKKTDAPLDFGGDGDFDSKEFDNIDNIIKGFDTPIAAAPMPKEEKELAPTPAPQINLEAMSAEDLLEDMSEVAPDESGEEAPEIVTPYVFPNIDFLAANKSIDNSDHTEELQSNAKILVETLSSFRVGIKEVSYSRGPTITRYELKPEVGTRVRSIANLVDDIALNLATSGVRIEAPIPGKAAVGIEVPNQTRATVYLRDLIDTPKFLDSKSKLTAALGMDVGGNPIYFDIGKMPHLLIAGTTGSGKSICINCIIVSILYKAKPEEVKLILIDPKKVEFNMYKNIPHLYCPIVSEPKKAAGALASAVAEMERRFELIEQAGVRDIASYNALAENDPSLEFMPHMVIIIDELADLMMTARDEVETSICRIAQKARAAGIHMILGTQRPSVDVITGLIKANVPSRIACTVMSQVDSRTIIDVAGAENLIGRGDMLFAPVGASKPMRVQGAFVSETEIDKIVTFIKENNGQAKYNTDFINKIEEEAAKCGMGKKGAGAVSDAPTPEGGDSKFSEAVKMAIEEGKISTSLMQRRLGVGYGRAAKIIDTMEDMGYVSKPDGNKPRRVLITMEEYSRRIMDGNLGNEE